MFPPFCNGTGRLSAAATNADENRCEGEDNKETGKPENIELEPLFRVYTDHVEILEQEQTRREDERQGPYENTDRVKARPIDCLLNPVGTGIEQQVLHLWKPIESVYRNANAENAEEGDAKRPDEEPDSRNPRRIVGCGV